ncbi:MAG: RNA polymerase sigma-70 factor [Bacteroidetes Order II. Incertae sedis bacterium]|nr:RNA polymerase sigma-70 factor [Bacteroidetes Order II. bacterium]
MSPETIQVWSRSIRNSDRKAFRALFEAFYTPLYRYTVLLIRDSEAAYDVVQEVFTKLWEMRDTLDEGRSLKALLYQMTRNRALNHIRDHQKKMTDWESVPEPIGETEQGIMERIDTSAIQEKLSGWIAELPERRREVFMLSRYDGLSHEEIATILNISPRTVNNHLGFALTELRQKVLTIIGGPAL